MLEQLLREVQVRGTANPAVLARRLNTSAAMIEAMLDELTRRGLLREISVACNEPCAGCQLAGSCGSRGNPVRLWQVRDRPQSAATY